MIFPLTKSSGKYPIWDDVVFYLLKIRQLRFAVKFCLSKLIMLVLFETLPKAEQRCAKKINMFKIQK